MTVGEVLESHCTVVALGTVSGIVVVAIGYDGTLDVGVSGCCSPGYDGHVDIRWSGKSCSPDLWS